MTTSDKHRFLALYDYGQGGIWVFIRARSEAEIHAVFRDLEVIETAPDWMTADEITRIEREMSFDIDEVKQEDWLFRLRRQAP